jgi:lysine-N-methylase
LIQLHLAQSDKQSMSAHGELGLRSDDRHCGLHGSDGNCLVQQHLGEGALSDTCFTYPRKTVQFGDRLEQSLTLSCPEAARLALTTGDAFDFVGADLTTRTSDTKVVAPVRGFALAAMEEVRYFSIQLCQTVALSNAERLMALGWLCRRLDEPCAVQSVGAMIAEMTELVQSGGLRKIAASRTVSHDGRAAVSFLLFRRNPNELVSSGQRHILESVRAGMGLADNEPLDPIVLSDRLQAGTAWLAQDGGVCEGVVGRYMLNELLLELFPWSKGSAMLNYQQVVIRYCILRCMLSAVANEQRAPLELETIVHVVQVFCRLFQHSSAFSEQLDTVFAESEWNTIDRLFALLD